MNLSVVIPILNEEANISPLGERLIPVMSSITPHFEVLFIDDGSCDGSLQAITELHAKDARMKALSLSRSFGHQAALTAGLDHARGEAVICMDGDLQHPPEVIPQLVDQWRKGHQIVYAVQDASADVPWFKRWSSTLFYRTFQRISGIPLPAHAADFRLLDRKVVDAFLKIRERNRFLRGLSSWVGYRSTSVHYQASPRLAGSSKYNIWRMMALAMDGLLSFSSVPLYMGVFVGFALGLATAMYVAFAIYSRFVTHSVLPGWTSVAVLIGGIGSLQLIVTGLMGLYIGKIYEEAKQRPLYLIRQQIGLESSHK